MNIFLFSICSSFMKAQYKVLFLAMWIIFVLYNNKKISGTEWLGHVIIIAAKRQNRLCKIFNTCNFYRI